MGNALSDSMLAMLARSDAAWENKLATALATALAAASAARSASARKSSSAAPIITADELIELREEKARLEHQVEKMKEELVQMHMKHAAEELEADLDHVETLFAPPGKTPERAAGANGENGGQQQEPNGRISLLVPRKSNRGKTSQNGGTEGGKAVARKEGK